MAPFLLLIAAGVPPLQQARAESPKAGELYRVRRDSSSVEQRGPGSTGTTEDHDTLDVRVLAVRADGVELLYDFPPDVPPGERASDWHLPAHVLRATHGPLQLLDRAELAARVDPWLKRGELTRAACGHLIFTWTAIRIDCDPDTVLAAIEAIDPTPIHLHAGALYSEAGSSGTAPLQQTTGPDGIRYTVTLPVDPNAIREIEAETAVAVGELSQKPVTLAAALADRAKESVIGTTEIIFVPDAVGQPRRRTRVTRLSITSADGKQSTRTSTETITRERLAAPAS